MVLVSIMKILSLVSIFSTCLASADVSSPMLRVGLSQTHLAVEKSNVEIPSKLSFLIREASSEQKYPLILLILLLCCLPAVGMGVYQFHSKRRLLMMKDLHDEFEKNCPADIK